MTMVPPAPMCSGVATWSRSGGEPFGLPTTLLVVQSRSPCVTFAVVAAGFASRYNAATPVLCGVAIDVPEMVLVAAGEPIHDDGMSTPGANQSTQLP